MAAPARFSLFVNRTPGPEDTAVLHIVQAFGSVLHGVIQVYALPPEAVATYVPQGGLPALVDNKTRTRSPPGTTARVVNAVGAAAAGMRPTVPTTAAASSAPGAPAPPTAAPSLATPEFMTLTAGSGQPGGRRPSIVPVATPYAGSGLDGPVAHAPQAPGTFGDLRDTKLKADEAESLAKRLSEERSARDDMLKQTHGSGVPRNLPALGSPSDSVAAQKEAASGLTMTRPVGASFGRNDDDAQRAALIQQLPF